MQAVCKSWTRRGPDTRLTDKFVRLTGAKDVLDLLEGLSRGRYDLDASAAMVVFEAAAEGDEVARGILFWMGEELASLAVGVIRQLGFETLEFEVVLTGSIYQGSPVIEEVMRGEIHKIAPKARLIPLNAPPVVGGVMLGMEQVGLGYSAIRDRLIEGAKELLAAENENA
jgi:N-acetylglucosamine kinase-like BadF-type ATPase